MSRVVFYNSDGEEVEVGTITYTRKQTNADRIRSMTDEELAVWLANGTINSEKAEGYWLDWLKQEVIE